MKKILLGIALILYAAVLSMCSMASLTTESALFVLLISTIGLVFAIIGLFKED